jgi:hypothetical protein
MTADRRSYDTGISQQVQGDLSGIIARLESVIGGRQSAVSGAMADFQADGVSEEYRVVEQRWNNAANEVRTIIDLLRTTMSRNDETASTTQTRASNAVQAIG